MDQINKHGAADSRPAATARPADPLQTEFDILVSPAQVHGYRDRLIQAEVLVPSEKAAHGFMTVKFREIDLLETTPGQPLRRHQYSEGFFADRILPAKIMLPPDRGADYRLEVHPIHAYCFESSRARPLIARSFPQISDPVIQNLVAGLMVTSWPQPPSMVEFNRCFRKPPDGVTQDLLDAVHHQVQENRCARGVILRNALATAQSTIRRSRNEVRQMGDLVFNPESDITDKFRTQHVLETGLDITIRKDVLESALQRRSEADFCPHAEKLKLEKLFAVSVDGRELSSASKLSLSAHDTFDHLYFFDLLQREPFAQVLLPKIANFSFSTTDDIFSIPSEYLAMVAYDWRAWQEMGMNHNRPVEPIVEAARETLTAAIENGQMPMLARVQVQELLALPNEDPRVQQFGFALSGILWENGEMAIKWGSLDLKPLETVRESSIEPWGPTPILEHPAYLAFVVCGLDALNNRENGASEVLQKINHTLEYRLAAAIKQYATSDDPYRFTLKIGDLRVEPAPDIPPEIKAWFQENIGFTAIRAPLCGD